MRTTSGPCPATIVSWTSTAESIPEKVALPTLSTKLFLEICETGGEEEVQFLGNVSSLEGGESWRKTEIYTTTVHY